MGLQLHETVMGRRLIEGTLPNIARSLERIADKLDKMGGSPELGAPATVSRSKEQEALIDLLGVLLRANAENGVWQAMHNEGICDAYMAAVEQGIDVLKEHGLAHEVERRYEIKLP